MGSGDLNQPHKTSMGSDLKLIIPTGNLCDFCMLIAAQLLLC